MSTFDRRTPAPDNPGAGSGRQTMSAQQAKQIARDTVRDLLAKHPPGLVVMILRELKTILRATKDITIYAPTEGKQTHENQNTQHP